MKLWNVLNMRKNEMLTEEDFTTPENIISYVSCQTFTIDSAPVGILVLENGTLICKTEYRENDICECYLVASGETYCGEPNAICKSILLDL